MIKLTKGMVIREKVEILKVMDFTHKEDNHLQYCMVKVLDAEFQPYVCYLYNAEFEEFNHGHYYASLADAEEKYEHQLAYYKLSGKEFYALVHIKNIGEYRYLVKQREDGIYTLELKQGVKYTLREIGIGERQYRQFETV